MNILFALYGDFTSNSANPLSLYARELQLRGHACAIAVPANLETISLYENPNFIPVLYADALSSPDSIFLDGRPADVIHACTPREPVRRFVTSYLAKRPTPFIIYLEDNESWIATRALGLDEETLLQHTEQEISALLPDSLAHPFYYDSFIGLADAVAVIQDKLRIKVPSWVHCEAVMIGVDLEFFNPRPAEPLLRKRYGVSQSEKVIVYHGGLNEFTRPPIETLCRAVGLINQHGYPCRLLRTGPFALNFLDKLPSDTTLAINDLGLLPKRELPDLLALADVFVQPGGIDPFEDLRLAGKVPEFLAMARPVVLPKVNIAHLFKDGLDAVFLHTGSAEEIAAKCIELFKNPHRATEIGLAGRRLAEKYFDVRAQAGILQTLYNKAITNFDPAIALETWRDAGPDTPVMLLLARKLKSLADANTALEFPSADILREHARYLEFTRRRLDGLEAVIAGRVSSETNAQLIRLRQQIAERDHRIAELSRAIDGFLNSGSWRLTSPLRKAKSMMARMCRRINSL